MSDAWMKTNTAVDSGSTPGKSSEDGFFGNVQSGFSRLGEAFLPVFAGYSKVVGEQILPNWTAKQMGLQAKDQLQDSTFDWAKAPLRLDRTTQSPEAPIKRTLFDMNVGPEGLLVMGAVLLGAVFIFKAVK